MTEVDTEDASTRTIAMSGEEPESPSTPDAAPKFAMAEFQYGIFVSLLVGCLVYGGTWLVPWLFKRAAPTTDAPAMSDVSPAGPASPQPRCRFGFGSCDWAGLHAPQPPCHGGVGACDWGGLHSPQPRCHDGAGKCDSAELRSPQPRCRYGVGRCDWAKKSTN
jgi:hypothetical protein